MKTNTTAKRIILEEIKENTHPENVEDVIFWALEHYSKSEPAGTWGRVIAHAIKERILSEESKEENNQKQDKTYHF
ncbi:hypothetical protein [Flavobacterium sp. JP2137]|uniref:hypothetical protein n=1 Tax=Flavobacterium sp. JP2137 TaxID=3414510 RepID=UPI003D2F9F51